MNKEIIDKAIIYLVLNNKDNDLNCVYNSIEMAHILSDLTSDTDIVVAGLLRNLIIDPNTNIEEIISIFGKDIVSLVIRNIDIDRSNYSSFRDINTARINFLKDQNIKEKMIIFASNLVNLRNLNNKYEELGDNIFIQEYFDKLDLCWYFSSILEQCNMFKDSIYYREYKSLLISVFSTRTYSKKIDF